MGAPGCHESRCAFISDIDCVQVGGQRWTLYSARNDSEPRGHAGKRSVGRYLQVDPKIEFAAYREES